MEQTDNKTWQVVLGLIVIIVIAWILIKSPSPTPTDELPADSTSTGAGTNTGTGTGAGANTGTGTGSSQNPNVNAKQLCYIWNTEGGDNAQLSMDIRGNAVTGEFLWRPAEKDQKTGAFTGTYAISDTKTGSGVAKTLWKSSGEGMTNTEELYIMFDNKIAAAGFGEMVRGSDGVWKYKDPMNVSYVPTLQATDCGDSAMD